MVRDIKRTDGNHAYHDSERSMLNWHAEREGNVRRWFDPVASHLLERLEASACSDNAIYHNRHLWLTSKVGGSYDMKSVFMAWM